MSVLVPDYYARNHGQDLTDWFVKHGRTTTDLLDLLATAETIERTKEPELNAAPSRFFSGRNGKKFMPALLARAVMDDLSIVHDPMTGLVYRWDGRVWESYDLSHVRSRALLMLDVEGSSSRAADVANMVKDLSTLPPGRKMNDHADLICLENGMFNLKTGKLSPHEQKYYSTHLLPIIFDPQHVPDCPTWKRCLGEWIADIDSIREAQKFAGYCLTRETRWEKMLLLFGPGGDGKSTFSNILRAMVGPDNCSHIPMGRLEDQFYLSTLIDKLINMSTEIESKAMQSQEIKAVISGDPVSAAFKNQTPFAFVPFCKLIFSTNRLPKMLDNSDGFFRKVMIIRFDGQFVKHGTADIFLKERLVEELPGIFAWALAGLDLLRSEGFRESAGMLALLGDYKKMNNNVLYYIDKHIVVEDGAKTGKAQAYKHYCERCRVYNLMPIGEPFFRVEFKRLLVDMGADMSDQKLSPDEHGRRENAYGGIRLVEEKPDECGSPSPYPFPEGFAP